jgi:hypothetical protein
MASFDLIFQECRELQEFPLVYAHAIHGQDDEAVQEWIEFQRKNRPAAASTPFMTS